MSLSSRRKAHSRVFLTFCRQRNATVLMFYRAQSRTLVNLLVFGKSWSESSHSGDDNMSRGRTRHAWRTRHACTWSKDVLILEDDHAFLRFIMCLFMCVWLWGREREREGRSLFLGFFSWLFTHIPSCMAGFVHPHCVEEFFFSTKWKHPFRKSAFHHSESTMVFFFMVSGQWWGNYALGYDCVCVSHLPQT